MHTSRPIFILLFVTLCALELRAQTEMQAQYATLNRAQPFFFDAINYGQPDEIGISNRLDIYVQIPYDIITFIRKDNQYVGNYTLTAIVSYVEDSKVIKEESWDKQIALLSFDRTRNPNSFDLSLRSMKLQPGAVMLELRYEDRESQKQFRMSRKIEVKKFDKNLFSMSDIMLVSNVEVKDGKKNITPQINPNVASLTSGFHLFYEIYNPFELGKISVKCKILKRSTTVFEKTDIEPCLPGQHTVIANIAPTGLSVGTYSINLTLSRFDDSTKSGVLAQAEKTFTIEWLNAGAPISITDLDEAIEQLRYFAKPADLDVIKDAPDEKEKRKKFEDFWERNNPAPGSPSNRAMVEYYNRVAYANEHFRHYVDGWKTDRGMVYIIYGPATAIDRHPLDVENKPYEIWEYFEINKRFLFVDETGFGDFRLLYPIWDDRNRMR